MFVCFYLLFMNCQKNKLQIVSLEDNKHMKVDGHLGEESDHEHEDKIKEPAVNELPKQPVGIIDAPKVNISPVFSSVPTNQYSLPPFGPPPNYMQQPVNQTSVIPVNNAQPPLEPSTHNVKTEPSEENNKLDVEEIKELVDLLKKDEEMKIEDDLFSEIQPDGSLKITDNSGRTLSESKNTGRLIWLERDIGSRFLHPGNDEEPNIIYTTNGKCLKRIENGVYVRDCPINNSDKDFLFTLKISKKDNEKEKNKELKPQNHNLKNIEDLIKNIKKDSPPRNEHKENFDLDVSILLVDKLNEIINKLAKLEDQQKVLEENLKSCSEKSGKSYDNDFKTIEKSLSDISEKLTIPKSEKHSLQEEKDLEEKKYLERKKEFDEINKKLQKIEESVETSKNKEQPQQPLIIPVPTPAANQSSQPPQQANPPQNKNIAQSLSSLLSAHPAFSLFNNLNPFNNPNNLPVTT